MANKIKSFFVFLIKSVKDKPIIAVIPASILGVIAAAIATVLIVNGFKSKDGMALSSSSYDSSSAVEAIAPMDEQEDISSVVSVEQAQKQVTYKGKTINVTPVEVANIKSKEDNENGSYIAEKSSGSAAVVSSVTIASCKGASDNYIYGIDVSSHNGNIDWSRVKQSGVQFAMIRCGYRGYLTGKIVMDACFEYNIENAYKNSIPVGVYFYSTAVNETEAIEEAAYVVELIKNKANVGIKVSYPVAYDFEEFYNTDDRSRAKTLSKSQISSNAAAFLDYIKSSGYKPMFYAGRNPMKNNFESYLAKKYNFWLANYANATEYEGKFFMWQFTSSGSVDGISGRVDLNVCGFENDDNLQRISICKNAGVVAYNKPDLSSGVALNLKGNEIYLYRNTYNGNFKELKIDGKYCYVRTTDLEAPFNYTNNTYRTSSAEQIYLYPVDDNSYKTGGYIPPDTELNVRGVWNNWAEIYYGGKVLYVKTNSLIVTDNGSASEDISSIDISSDPSDTSSADTPSDTSSVENSSEDNTP